MIKYLQTLLILSALFIFSCKKDDSPLVIQSVNNSAPSSTNTNNTTTQAVPKEDGYISANVNNSLERYALHTLDCKGSATDFDNSYTTLSDGSKQLEMIRNATQYVGSNRWEITAGDDLDKMKLPYKLTTGSLSWVKAVSATNEITYRGLFSSSNVEVIITSKTGDRLQGTFKGVLLSDNSSGSDNATNSVNIQNGHFDIQIVRKTE